MNKDYILNFERYLGGLTNEEYEALIQEASEIAENILKEKQLTV